MSPVRFVMGPKRAPGVRVAVAVLGPHVRVYSPRSQLARIYASIRDEQGRVRWRHVFTQPALGGL